MTLRNLQVRVNKDTLVEFRVRIPTHGVNRTVLIKDVDQNDSRISLVEVNTVPDNHDPELHHDPD